MSINVIGKRTVVEQGHVEVEIPEILQGLMYHFHIDANIKEVEKSDNGDYCQVVEQWCGSHSSWERKKLELSDIQKTVMDSIFNLYCCYWEEKRQYGK